MRKTEVKLVLSQETLRNLTADELRVVAGGSVYNSACTCPTTTQPLSCIECNPPVA